MDGTSSWRPLFAAGPEKALSSVTLWPREFRLVPRATKGTVWDLVPPMVANKTLYPSEGSIRMERPRRRTSRRVIFANIAYRERFDRGSSCSYRVNVDIAHDTFSTEKTDRLVILHRGHIDFTLERASLPSRTPLCIDEARNRCPSRKGSVFFLYRIVSGRLIEMKNGRTGLLTLQFAAPINRVVIVSWSSFRERVSPDRRSSLRLRRMLRASFVSSYSRAFRESLLSLPLETHRYNGLKHAFFEL